MFLFKIIEWLFLLLSIFAFFSTVWYSLRLGISPMPSSNQAKEAMLSMLPPNPSGQIMDLGAGWGNLVFPTALQFPETKVVAYEGSLIPWLFLKLRLFFQPRANLTIHRKDFFASSLHEATFVLCYLFPGAMQRLAPKFQEELKEGTQIISNAFALPHWKPKQTLVLDDLLRTRIYLYEKNSQNQGTKSSANSTKSSY